ncbi:anthranilate phosphoribosyltransferase [Komagataeibacter sp. FNDCF1]|uniref:anthranilate phosphoribosyltransferase n=1 Tax=Komagataeibacter sp. FNDCF1 TaxID=2878681 RepID=UPI001E3C9AFB|nr:anthranilate phosphoribosyltransferase [Komagataeibacter sp. FNDCF1]MCE2564044.1 anthranilate phosphoribosyltransferase [Komagataeibacter sp. FNDCF1]
MAGTMDSGPSTSDTFRAILGRAVAGGVVAPEEAQAALRSIENGDVEQVPAIAFLTALRMQGRVQADPVELEAVLRHRAPGPAGPASGFTDILDVVLDGRDLTPDMAQTAFGLIMDGAVSDAVLAAFLTALHMRGESVTELHAAVRAIRARMLAVPAMPDGALDVCGTGGDGLGTLNVSTAVAFVLAAMGVPVAKHGNRALSSRSGATDVLLELDVPLPVDNGHIGRMMAAHCVTFLAAPNHHPAMRHVGMVRRALGFRTIFNLIGPLCNPAEVRRQLVGVFSPDWLEVMVRTLREVGSERVWAVSGECGQGRFIDELTLAGPTHACVLEDGSIRRVTIHAQEAGLATAPIAAIAGGTPAHNARALRELAQGARGAYRDTVLLNAGVALHVAGRGSTIMRGGEIDYAALRGNIGLAADALDRGAVAAVLEAVRNFRADVPNRVTG